MLYVIIMRLTAHLDVVCGYNEITAHLDVVCGYNEITPTLMLYVIILR